MANRKRRQYSVDAATFADRLNRLFAVIQPPGRGPYRSFEVTEALSRRDYRLSAPYLSQLRSGTRKYPSPRTAEMLAEFFGVEVEYFDPDTSYARALDAELDWLELAHDETVRELTTALMTLTPGQRDEVLGSVEECQFDCATAIAEQMAALPPVGVVSESGSGTTGFVVTGRPSRRAARAGCAQA